MLRRTNPGTSGPSTAADCQSRPWLFEGGMRIDPQKRFEVQHPMLRRHRFRCEAMQDLFALEESRDPQ